MPFTPAQRRLFHEVEENPDAARRHGMSREEGGKLAREADELASEGKEKREKKASVGFIDLTPVFGAPDWSSGER